MRKTIKRRKLLRGIGAGTIASLAGCIGVSTDNSGSNNGNVNGSNNGDATNAKGKSTIGQMADSATLWAWEIEGSANQDLAKKYNEKTGADITAKKLGDSTIHSRLQSTILSGSGAPTMSQETSRRVPNYIDTNGLLDISSWMKTDKLDSDFVDFKMAQMKGNDGGIYGIPIDTGPVTMYYQKSVADKYNLDFESIKTYNDYKEEGKKLPDDKYLTQIARSTPVDHWRLYVRQMKGNAINDEGRIVIHSEKGVAAANWMNELVQLDLAILLDDWSASFFAQFKNGNIASLPGASWMAGTLKDSIPSTSGQWRVRKLPKFSNGFGGTATQQGGSAFVIPKQNNTPHQRRAYDYAKFSVTKDSSVKYRINNYTLFPAVKSGFKTDAIDQPVEFFGGTKAYKIMAEVISDVPLWNWSSDTPSISESLNTQLTKMMNGDLSPKKAMQKAAKDVANRTGREMANL